MGRYAGEIILLVEDNPDDVALTLRALKACGASTNVVVAKDGVEALDFLFGTGNHLGRDVHDVPKVVLLDLNLPKVDGLEVLERIRRDDRTRLVPVVILTTSSERRDVVRGYGLGANSYIRKPVDYVRFMDYVSKMASYWLSLNRTCAAANSQPSGNA